MFDNPCSAFANVNKNSIIWICFSVFHERANKMLLWIDSVCKFSFSELISFKRVAVVRRKSLSQIHLITMIIKCTICVLFFIGRSIFVCRTSQICRRGQNINIKFRSDFSSSGHSGADNSKMRSGIIVRQQQHNRDTDLYLGRCEWLHPPISE